MAVEIPVAASPIAVERVSPKTVQQAVNSLLKWRNSKSQIEKPKLFDEDDEFFYLILTLKKIPPKARVKPHKVLLPNSLASEFSENLLIIDDGPKSNLTKEDVQKKIKAENIPVSKVLKLSKLKANYRPFEAKRKLCDSYTMFFSDKKVIPLLPRLLGKQFFKKKKIPVPLDLTHKNWKEQIEKANSSALLFLRTGTCCVVKVAKVSMEEDEIVANVVAAINGIVEVVPKKWGNVRSFHLKMFDSLALPLYQTVPDLKLKIEGAKLEEDAEKEAKDIAKNEAKKGLKVGKKRGRIREVRYMDANVDGEHSQDEFGDEDDGVIEEEHNEKDEMSGGELVDKKKKKGVKADKGALSELNSVKELKKAPKSMDKNVKPKKARLSAKGKKEDEFGDEDDGVTEEEDNEKDETSGGELVDKKKKKGVEAGKGALSELNSVKELKKASKGKDKSVKRKKDGLSAKRKKENVLPSEDAESGKKKMKRSGVVKPDGGNMKVKAKKK